MSLHNKEAGSFRGIGRQWLSRSFVGINNGGTVLSDRGRNRIRALDIKSGSKTAERTSLHNPRILELLENENFVSERFQGRPDLDRETFDAISNIYTTVFKPVLTNFYGEKNVDLFIEDNVNGMKRDLSRDDTNLVLLREKEGNRIVGFSYFYPSKESSETVEIGNTAILENFRGQGGWSLMMQNLDHGILSNSRYKTMIRTVRTANDYAEKVRRRYHSGIINEQEINSSVGPQKEFTIRLGNNPLKRYLSRSYY